MIKHLLRTKSTCFWYNLFEINCIFQHLLLAVLIEEVLSKHCLRRFLEQWWLRKPDSSTVTFLHCVFSSVMTRRTRRIWLQQQQQQQQWELRKRGKAGAATAYRWHCTTTRKLHIFINLLIIFKNIHITLHYQ